MRHPFRWIALAAGVGVALLAVILAVNVGTDPRAELNTSALLGQPAPEFALTRLDGTKVTLADLAGKTVIVNFWNSWCRPCLDELPDLQSFYAAHRNDPSVVMVGIPRDDTATRIRDAARDKGMGWRWPTATSHSFMRGQGPSSLPFWRGRGWPVQQRGAAVACLRRPSWRAPSSRRPRA